MESNRGLRIFKSVLVGIYEFMCNIYIPVFGFEISLWNIFLFGAIGGIVVWFIKKVF